MKRKHEDEDEDEDEDEQSNNYGDGEKWLRGALIGEGSFGSVFVATLKNPVARYDFLPPIMAVKSAEVSVSGSLEDEREVLDYVYGSPYVLQTYGEETTTGKNGDFYNLLLEYASGGTLGNLIEKTGGCGLPESDVRCYTRSILQGLCHVHNSGFVHCDLKPDNILLAPVSGDKFIPKIGDFGLAKRAGDSHRSKKRRMEDIRGTPLYISPEAVVDYTQEQPSDIWALGCVVLEMLTGKPAWDGDEDSDCQGLLARIANEHELPQIPSDISKEGKDFLQGCFVRNPMYRLTAEMLLNHPFVAELHEEGEVQEFHQVSDAQSDCYTSVDDDDGADDGSYLHLPSCSSWSQMYLAFIESTQPRRDAISSSLSSNDHHVFSTSSELPRPAFTIQAGA